MNTEQTIELKNFEQTIEYEHLRNLVDKTLHITFQRPVRVNLMRIHSAHGSVRIDAVDGMLTRVSSGSATIEVETVYACREDVPDSCMIGLQGFVHHCTIVHPISFLGSVVAAAE